MNNSITTPMRTNSTIHPFNNKLLNIDYFINSWNILYNNANIVSTEIFNLIDELLTYIVYLHNMRPCIYYLKKISDDDYNYNYEFI